MKFIIYAHGWVGAAALDAVQQFMPIEKRIVAVTYDKNTWSDAYPCPALGYLVYRPGVTRIAWPVGDTFKADNNTVVITANWRHKLPKVLYQGARLAINVHNSLLPAFKGRRPVQRALTVGEVYFGFTIHRLSDQVDSGEILYQHTLRLPKREKWAYELLGISVGTGVTRVLEENL